MSFSRLIDAIVDWRRRMKTMKIPRMIWDLLTVAVMVVMVVAVDRQIIYGNSIFAFILRLAFWLIIAAAILAFVASKMGWHADKES